jgi:hypothetical protein
VAGRSLGDYVPVLPATLEREWAIDPKRGIETREVADGVYVVTDGVWQSAFVVTEEGVIVLDAPQTFGARIPAEVAAVTAQPITTPRLHPTLTTTTSAVPRASVRSRGWRFWHSPMSLSSSPSKTTRAESSQHGRSRANLPWSEAAVGSSCVRRTITRTRGT